MLSIYDDDLLVGDLTREALERTGSRLLQIHRFAAEDQAHVDALLQVFKPKAGARIADVGCGVGGLAELMNLSRPDLVFTLINHSPTQLGMCQPWRSTVYGKAEALPLSPGEVDAILASYVLGHVDLDRFISECRRVLQNPDAVIYVYDIFRQDDAFGCLLERDLMYADRTANKMVEAFRRGGFSLLRGRRTNFVPKAITELLPSPDTILNTESAAMVFVKQ